MPVATIALDDTNVSILTPIYVKIVKDVVEAIRLPSDIPVNLYRNIETAMTDLKSNASGVSSDNLPTVNTTRRVIAVATEDYDEDTLASTTVTQINAPPVFVDEDINVSVYPAYINVKCEIEINYVSPSIADVNRVRDQLRMRVSKVKNTLMHSVDYTIIVPRAIEEFIADVYDLKNRLVPMTLESYFNYHTTGKMHPITDLSNESNIRLGIAERQTRIQGEFDFSSIPNKMELDPSTSTYKLTIPYKVTINLPIAINMRYPVMICNRPMPSKYVKHIEEYKLKNMKEYNSDTPYTDYGLQSMRDLEYHAQLENRIDITLPVNIPLFDEFKLRQGYKGYGIVVSFLTDVNEIDKRSLFNLKDISPYYISSNLLNFISTIEKDYVVKPYQSFIYLGLHQEDAHYDNSILSIDSNLNISSTRDLTLFKPIRVTIGVCIDISMLSEQAIRRLKDNPEIFLLYINEYMYTMLNFMNEVSSRRSSLANFYRLIIEYTAELLDKDDLVTLYKLYKIIEAYPYYNAGIGELLLNGYQDTYLRLYRGNIVSVSGDSNQFSMIVGDVNDLFTEDGVPKVNTSPVNYYNNNLERRIGSKESRANIEKAGMKTVESGYVIAYRMTDL